MIIEIGTFKGRDIKTLNLDEVMVATKEVAEAGHACVEAMNHITLENWQRLQRVEEKLDTLLTLVQK